MSKFNLTYAQLKEKAKIRDNEPSDSTTHRWIQLGLITSKKHSHGNLYSKESVEQLKLCIKLRNYGKNIHDMKLLFKKYPLGFLRQKIGKITPGKLNQMINKKKK